MPKSQRENNTKSGSRPGRNKRTSQVQITSGLHKKPRGRFASFLHPSHGPAEHRCAKHYVETVLDPFNTKAGACVPMLPCLDSAKRKVFARGTGMTQTNGFGGICATTSTVNDKAAVYVTDGTGSGTTMTGTMNVAHNSNSEITNAGFTAGTIQARIVGCGVRIRCIGKPIDMNGRTFAIEEPSHQDTQGLGIANLALFDINKVKTKHFGPEWSVACWQPVRPGEQAYQANAYASTVSPVVTTAPLCILVQSQSALQLPFEWEWFLHYEAVGSSARGKSESHIAPIAGPKAIAALQKLPSAVFDDVSNKRTSAGQLADTMISLGSSVNWQTLADSALKKVRAYQGKSGLRSIVSDPTLGY